MMVTDRHEPVVELRGVTVHYGARSVWEPLDLVVGAGEFVAVLGPNGAGKTTLLRTLLGLLEVSGGSIGVCGRSPRRGRSDVGYVPQQRGFDPDLPIRGRDLVRFGLDGHRWGLPWVSRRTRGVVDAVIADVGATAFAAAPVGTLSGGEQQRLRIAQALLGNPELLLCDEPLLSLDLAHQQAVTALIDRRRREAGTAVLFVTHEINPVLTYVDRVLYLAAGRWAAGTPDEVLTSAVLSQLYGAPVDVLRIRDRILVVGDDEAHAGAHHAEEAPR